jgi:hypothetical protein
MLHPRRLADPKGGNEICIRVLPLQLQGQREVMSLGLPSQMRRAGGGHLRLNSRAPPYPACARAAETRVRVGGPLGVSGDEKDAVTERTSCASWSPWDEWIGRDSYSRKKKDGRGRAIWPPR